MVRYVHAKKEKKKQIYSSSQPLGILSLLFAFRLDQMNYLE